jgi:hypothetical protein
MDRGKGAYIGTEIDEKWWKRYRKDKFFARGNGKYWLDQNGFCFRRYLTKRPICVPFERTEGIKLGKWHAGRWCGGLLVVKILWKKDGQSLSSGFVVSKSEVDTNNLKAELERRIGRTGPSQSDAGRPHGS